MREGRFCAILFQTARKWLILNGEMSEWLKEHAWKACVGETLPRVRIPLSPPTPSPVARSSAVRVVFRLRAARCARRDSARIPLSARFVLIFSYLQGV